ncbi:MAG: hypothetical protein AAF609_09630 [Cyanobacteria bacterium P01_C01_bin.120]
MSYKCDRFNLHRHNAYGDGKSILRWAIAYDITAIALQFLQGGWKMF